MMLDINIENFPVGSIVTVTTYPKHLLEEKYLAKIIFIDEENIQFQWIPSLSKSELVKIESLQVLLEKHSLNEIKIFLKRFLSEGKSIKKKGVAIINNCKEIERELSI